MKCYSTPVRDVSYKGLNYNQGQSDEVVCVIISGYFTVQ